jgi:hypothetical protein
VLETVFKWGKKLEFALDSDGESDTLREVFVLLRISFNTPRAAVGSILVEMCFREEDIFQRPNYLIDNLLERGVSQMSSSFTRQKLRSTTSSYHERVKN